MLILLKFLFSIFIAIGLYFDSSGLCTLISICMIIQGLFTPDIAATPMLTVAGLFMIAGAIFKLKR